VGLILKTCLLHVCMPLDHYKIGATPKETTTCKVHSGCAASYVSPRNRNLSKSSVSRKHHYKSKSVRHFEASPSLIVPSSAAGEFAGCLTIYAGHTRGLATCGRPTLVYDMALAQRCNQHRRCPVCCTARKAVIPTISNIRGCCKPC
jgi:hypothetical protein